MQLPGKAEANPTKAFFVRMITRDISLADCILDLIDNSVDAAWQLRGSKPNVYSNTTSLSAFHIEISASALKFNIRDNCGGITLDNAAKYAFTFGRDDEMEHEAYSIGVYGIGMKRAIFKLGSIIQIRSTYSVESRGKAKSESFRVPINVTKWLAAKAWDFDLELTTVFPKRGLRFRYPS
jgi:DNA topoisomerase VI subunit B